MLSETVPSVLVCSPENRMKTGRDRLSNRHRHDKDVLLCLDLSTSSHGMFFRTRI